MFLTLKIIFTEYNNVFSDFFLFLLICWIFRPQMTKYDLQIFMNNVT